MTPPSPAITVRIVGATDVGLIREHNEDNYTVLNVDTGEVDFSQGREIPMPASGALLVVCDGMGGAAAGEVASHMAVEVLRRELGPKIVTPTPATPATDSSKVEGEAAAKPQALPEGGDKASPPADLGKTSDGLASGDTAAVPTPPDASKPELATADKPGQSPSKDAKDAPAGTSDVAPAAEKSAPASQPPAAAMQAQVQAVVPEVSGPLSEAQLHGVARKVRLAGQRANQEIYDAACADISKNGMGTTLTCLMLLHSHVIVGQVGDSRAYLWRKGRLTQITHDQSLVNQLLESGQITPEQAKLFEHSNVILQALGVQEDVEVVLSTETVRRGDRLMLCSDGLVGVVSDEEIQDVLTNAEHIEEATRRLIELARAGGGPDNITVIVAQVDGEGVPAPAENELAEYRVLYLDGEKPPERRMWGSEYAFMSPTPSARDGAAMGATDAPVSSRLSVVSMAAVFALLVIGVLAGVLYQPLRAPTSPTSNPQPQPALPPPTLPTNPAPAGTANPPPTAASDAGAGIAATAAAADGGAATAAGAMPPTVPPTPAGAADGGASDVAAAAREPEENKGPPEAVDPDEAGKKKARKKRKKPTEEPGEEPASPAQPAVAPATPPTTPTPEPSADKPAPVSEKPAAPVEKPAAPVEKPAAPVEKPAAPAEKPAAPAEKPADKPAVATPSPAN